MASDSRLRVDAMTIAIHIMIGDKHEVVYEEEFNPDQFVGFSPENLFELKRQISRDYYVKPSFQHLAERTIETLSESGNAPEGIRHTMDQIQDWYHKRYVSPFAPSCAICGWSPAKHGPSSSHQFTKKEA